MSQTVVLAHNIRSAHNVGSLFRTCEFLGVSYLVLSGYTPYPSQPNDSRLPHEARRVTERIHKTALGTEEILQWRHVETWQAVIAQYRNEGYDIVALEQHSSSLKLSDYKPHQNTFLVLGEEVDGISDDLLASVDTIVEIPRLGKKESLNVVQASAIAVAHIQFANQ